MLYFIYGHDIEHNRWVWHQTHYEVTDKNNKVSLDRLGIYFHNSSYRTRCDTRDTICRDLHYCRYYIYIYIYIYIYSLVKLTGGI